MKVQRNKGEVYKVVLKEERNFTVFNPWLYHTTTFANKHFWQRWQHTHTHTKVYNCSSQEYLRSTSRCQACGIASSGVLLPRFTPQYEAVVAQPLCYEITCFSGNSENDQLIRKSSHLICFHRLSENYSAQLQDSCISYRSQVFYLMSGIGGQLIYI